MATAGLREMAPVYLTLGNHDHYSAVPIEQFSAWADRHDVTLLVNQTAFLTTDRGELAVAGVDDPSLHRADLRCLPQPSPNRFTLLLAHAPNILDQLEPHHDVDLILCGHSHGGQWQIPGIPTLWLPPGCNGRIAVDITMSAGIACTCTAAWAGPSFHCGSIAGRRWR